MHDLLVILPLIIVGSGAIGLMLLASFQSLSRESTSILTMGIFGFAFFVQFAAPNSPDIMPFHDIFNGMMVVNTFTKVAGLIILGCGFFSTMIAQTYFTQENEFVMEFYSLMLFAVCGMLLLTLSSELITIFISIEIMSLAVYTLVGYDRKSVVRSEAVLKYLMLGAFAGAFFVMGTVFIYAGAKSTTFSTIAGVIADSGFLGSPTMVVGAFLILVALFFKVAAFPFHAWVVDVYDGAPMPITGFMATAVKTAVFAVLVNFLVMNSELRDSWITFLFYISVITMLAGNLIALGQDNLKRMLAASGIVHTGYLLIAVAAVNAKEFTGGAVLYYLAAYAVSTLGLFAALTYLGGKEEQRVSFDDFRGLARVRPYSAAAISIFLLSMAGIPPTAGFMGKFYVITSAIEADLIFLAVFGIFSSILSMWYYLRLIIVMYFREPEDQFEITEMTFAPIGTIILAFSVFAMSFFPVVL